MYNIVNQSENTSCQQKKKFKNFITRSLLEPTEDHMFILKINMPVV